MNIIARGRAFVQKLQEIASRSAWDWRQCPTCKHGGYYRHPWTLEGRKDVRVQRHLCYTCDATYSEAEAWLVRGSWYAREVHRCAVDHWMHTGAPPCGARRSWCVRIWGDRSVGGYGGQGSSALWGRGHAT